MSKSVNSPEEAPSNNKTENVAQKDDTSNDKDETNLQESESSKEKCIPIVKEPNIRNKENLDSEDASKSEGNDGIEEITKESERISRDFEDSCNVDNSNLHLKIFDEFLKKEEDQNRTILRNIGTFKQSFVKSVSDLYAGDHPTPSDQREGSDGDEKTGKNRVDADMGQKLFYQNMLKHASLIQSQESRKSNAETTVTELEKNTESKELECQRLFLEGLRVRENTIRMKEKVEQFEIYKDYMESSVPFWDKEAGSIDAICGRFRDLLTLRRELLHKVEVALQELNEVKEKEQILIESEKTEESRALLKIYQQKSQVWAMRTEAEKTDEQLRAFRKKSNDIAFKLTQIRLALANMYSVARRFQCSLPAVDYETSSEVIVKRLQHFIEDAGEVVKVVQLEESPDSTRPDIGSA